MALTVNELYERRQTYADFVYNRIIANLLADPEVQLLLHSDTFNAQIAILNGGKGSGNFGHAGRPGQEGGSSSGAGGGASEGAGGAAKVPGGQVTDKDLFDAAKRDKRAFSPFKPVGGGASLANPKSEAEEKAAFMDAYKSISEGINSWGQKVGPSEEEKAEQEKLSAEAVEKSGEVVSTGLDLISDPAEGFGGALGEHVEGFITKWVPAIHTLEKKKDELLVKHLSPQGAAWCKTFAKFAGATGKTLLTKSLVASLGVEGVMAEHVASAVLSAGINSCPLLSSLFEVPVGLGMAAIKYLLPGKAREMMVKAGVAVGKGASVVGKIKEKAEKAIGLNAAGGAGANGAGDDGKIAGMTADELWDEANKYMTDLYQGYADIITSDKQFMAELKDENSPIHKQLMKEIKAALASEAK